MISIIFLKHLTGVPTFFSVFSLQTFKSSLDGQARQLYFVMVG